MSPRALTAWALGLALCSSVLAQNASSPAPQRFFDDFSQASVSALSQQGWMVRTAAGHPGVPGARWSAEGLSLVRDPQAPGQQWLRLSARTDGTPEGTQQTQLCQPRKFLEGTYAARVRFTDTPVQGEDGDPVIQTFYAVSPLKHDFDPEFSEIDWEFLPNGGWGSPVPRLYGITWQTVRLEPWLAFNDKFELPEVKAGWHTLVVQVMGGQTRWFVDGRPVGQHGGRNYPVVPMALSFNLWFSPGGLLPPSATPRVYEQDVDWVLHVRQAALSPAQIEQEVQRLRQAGHTTLDTLPPASAELAHRCDF